MSSTSFYTPTASSTTNSSTSLYHNGTSPAAPLTTVYTPAVSCQTITTWYYKDECMPTNWRIFWDGPQAGYYSPAICPSGYTPACLRPDPSTANYGPPLEMGETARICCPL